MSSIKTNSVLKAVNKVAVKKVVSEATKKAMAKKRALNPQFANVQSAKRKVEKNAFKTDAILCLLEVKRTAGLTNVNTKSYKNIVYQNECKTAINFIVKNKVEFLPLVSEAVGKIKGNFNVYRFEQLIQSLVKFKIEKGNDFKTTLNAIISANKLK